MNVIYNDLVNQFSNMPLREKLSYALHDVPVYSAVFTFGGFTEKANAPQYSALLIGLTYSILSSRSSLRLDVTLVPAVAATVGYFTSAVVIAYSQRY